MFKSRVALAATLSSNYGIYNGFELIEHEPIPGREEYLNSEKYEIKTRDWNKPGNIKDYIARLNRIRRANPALLQTNDLRFLQVDDDNVIGFVKESAAHDNAVAVRHLARRLAAGILAAFRRRQIGPPDTRRGRCACIENLVTGERHLLEWGGIRLRIDPADDPALLFPLLSRECAAMNVRPDIDVAPRPGRRRPLVQGRRSSISCTSRRSADSNDDGVGDFAGLTERLDYLQRPRRHDALAAAVLSEPRPRRRLRHLRLRRHQSRTSAR